MTEYALKKAIAKGLGQRVGTIALKAYEAKVDKFRL